MHTKNRTVRYSQRKLRDIEDSYNLFYNNINLLAWCKGKNSSIVKTWSHHNTKVIPLSDKWSEFGGM